MGYSIIDNKVAYYFVPKCASRTILAYSYIVKNLGEYDSIKEKLYPYEKTYDFLNEDSKPWIKNTNHYPIKFCIVRDPVDRFISAFVDRIKRTKKWQYMHDYTISKFIETIDDPEFNSPNNTLYYEPYANAKFHMKPLVDFLDKNPNFYTNIFNIKKLDEVKHLIEYHSGIKLPDLNLNSSAKYEKPVLTHSEIEWIKQRYQKDYEIYGKWM